MFSVDFLTKITITQNWSILRYCQFLNIEMSRHGGTCFLLKYRDKGMHCSLTISSIYTQFNTLKKEKGCRKTLWKKVKLLKMSNFTFFHNVTYAVCVSKCFNSHISVSASLNLGRSQNDVLGNGLTVHHTIF